MLYLLHWEESREWALRQILGVISLFFYQSMEKSLKERVRRGSEWREGDELDSVRISGKDGVTQRDNESSDKEFEAEKGSKDKRAAKKEVKNNFGLTAEEEAIMIDDPLQAANSMFEALISSLEQSRTMLMIYTGHIKITISHSESSNFQSSSTVNKLNISSAFPNISPSISSSTSSSSSTSTSTSSISKSFSEETDKLSIHLPLLTTCPISNCLLTIVEPAVHIIQARMSVLLAAVSGSLSVGESVPLPFLLSNSSPLSSASPSSSSNLAAHSPVSLSSVTGLTSSVLLLLQLASNIHFFTQKLHKMIFGEAQQQNSVESKSENGASEKTKNRMMQDVILEGKGEFEEGEENVGLADKLKEWYFAEIPVSLFVHSSSSSPSSSSSSSSSSSTSVSNSTSINSSSVSNSSSSSVNSYQQMMSTEANESQMITDLCFNSATFHKHFNEIVAANADKYTSDVIVPLSVFCPSSFAFIGNLAHQRYSMTASATSSSSAINHIDMQENESENENLVGSASDGSDLPEPLDASGVANHSQNEHSSNVISEGSRENAEAKKKASRKSAAASVVPPRYLSALPSIFNELRAEVEESMLLFFSSLSTLGDTLSSALPAPTAMSAQASQSNSSSAASSASSSASEASTYLASTLKLLRLIFRIIGNVCSRDREIRESSVVKTDIKGVVITDYDSDADVVEELESKLDDVMLSMILMPCRLLCFNFASRFSSTNQSALFLINSISLILNTLSSLTPVKSITNDNKEEVTQKPSPIRESIRLSLSADLAVQTDSLSTLEAGNVLQDAHLWSLYSKSVNWYSKNRQKIEEEIKKAEGNSVFSQTEQESASNELKWNVNGMENILSVSGCSASEVTLGLSRFCSSVMSSSGLETKLIEQIADGDVRRVVLRKCMKIVESSYMKMYHFVCCPEMPYLNFVPDMKSRIMSPSEIIELLEYTAK
ncbi:uncharacterized protein MONOS_1635 [Monocercomonoides exilis]|uniref:uncharacterized protein n=1 Tax=Monocercomonoides exilis TaxID=2049356 RepID=UPI00355AB60E|nr:hypothetical protein MONOS_1635 [Monocercomonoides exilis]|eukprot:MONOS_1635.1-p1 / transcript=MONOS_1635.1 / gene=MONOS_1635 / organism=Monocercomonoides_exilis_PA203 / gene_product=unspecified product / transcript_product=unspecified product / location=Mono_scaffold00030:38211-41290(+) / protein_length=948 / sequence_SO=supercontig / SO=protein_coding / is_pseudo=false